MSQSFKHPIGTTNTPSLRRYANTTKLGELAGFYLESWRVFTWRVGAISLGELARFHLESWRSQICFSVIRQMKKEIVVLLHKIFSNAIDHSISGTFAPDFT